MSRAAVMLALWGAAWCPAQTIRIAGGAADGQVFPRDARNTGRIEISGVVAGAPGKFLEARITRKFVPLEGFNWKLAAKLNAGKFVAILEEVPAGGPYEIDLRVPGTRAEASVHNVLVGDLWILAGQSNMEGYGDLVDVEPPNALVHNFDQMDRWVLAEEPLHNLRGAADRVHWTPNAEGKPERLEGLALARYNAERRKGGGLGLPFAVEMVKRTGVPVGLISCAHGGTSMDQWDPALRDKGGDSLYGSMYRRFRAAGGRAAGMLWYQGESDANPESGPAFAKKFQRFIAQVRQDFKQPDLPFYYVQIGRHISASNEKEWNALQEAQRQAELTIPRVGMAASVDLALDDGIHIDTQEHKRLGRRLARLATGGKRGPRPVSVRRDGGLVLVTFSDVNGSLRAPGRIAGFSIHLPDGANVPVIFKATVDPRDPNTIALWLDGKLPENAALYYGLGKDPYCNVVDAEDIALPVFGPMAIPAN